MAPPDLGDSIRRHPSSLAPPERHRRFGPWGILAAVVSAGVLITGGAMVLVLMGPQSRSPSGSEVIDGPAPEFDLTSVDGRTEIRLSELRGRVVVVSFERDGCAPCRAAELALDQTWHRFRGQGVLVLAVRHETLPVATTLSASPGAWPVLSDPGGKAADAFGVHGVPETFVIDPGGRVVAGLAGPVTYSVLAAQISMLIGPPRRTEPSDGPSPSPSGA